MTDTSTETSRAAVARDAAGDTAQEAVAQGREVAATTVDQVREVAAVGTEQVATLGHEALGQARTVLDSASGDVRDQLEERLRTLVDSARTTADELQALVDGRPEEAGRTRDLARSASQQVNRLADRADELGIQGVVEEVSDLARRRPVLFLAGAATAGLLVGRMARAGKEVQGSGSGGGSAPQPSVAATGATGTLGAAGAGVSSGETGLAGAGVTGPTPPLPPPDPAPLPPPAAPGMDPGGSASGWVGS